MMVIDPLNNFDKSWNVNMLPSVESRDSSAWRIISLQSFTNLMVAGIQQIQLIHNRLGQQESLKLSLSARQTIEAALLSRNF